MHVYLRAVTILLLSIASVLLGGEFARAQRLANGRPARAWKVAPRVSIHEIAEQDSTAQEAIENPVAEESTAAPPLAPPVPSETPLEKSASPNLEVVTPEAPRIDGDTEPGPETECDDRSQFGLGKGLGFGLGKLCRPRFGLGFGGMTEYEQMSGASWLRRPLHVDVFSGVIYGGPLIEDSIRRQGDMFNGFRLGWDWTRRLGGEMRFGFAQIGTEDIPSGIELDDADVVYWDLNVLWYPTGDTRIRPFLSLGLGAQHIDFIDALNNGHQKELFAVPIGAGIKYRATPWCAVRADITDNIAFPYDDIVMQGNISITVSAEFHFGGPERRSYWPWSPTLQSW